MDDDALLRRAMAAYYRRALAHCESPSRHSSVEEIDGRSYVVLRSGHKPLAVYRVTNQGTLKALRRPPAALMGEQG